MGTLGMFRDLRDVRPVFAKVERHWDKGDLEDLGEFVDLRNLAGTARRFKAVPLDRFLPSS